jgi:putative glutamine amidotransferase
MTPWRRPLPTFLAERTDLYTLGAEYPAAIIDAGGLPVLLPHLDDAAADELLDDLDGLVLCGGDDVDPASYGAEDDGVSHGTDPAADRWELALARAAVERKVPALGICRGAQILNVALGGTLRQDIAADDSPHPPTPADPEAVLAQRHPVELAPDSRLARLYGTEQRVVNTIHHQALDRVADALVPVAWAPDGIVEAVEARDPDAEVLAVQWHPEKILDDGERPLFADLVGRASAYRAERKAGVAR